MPNLVVLYNKDLRQACMFAYIRIMNCTCLSQVLPTRLKVILPESKNQTHSSKMPIKSILTPVFLVFLYCGSAAVGIRRVSSSDSTNGGICKSMVETKGYVCEEHEVTTKDGYIISLQRIPAGRAGEGAGKKQPVMLQHGLLMDGVTWLLLPPEESLGFMLADNGYDVWISNTRGTKYSRRHVSLSPQDKVYWDWSWDELVAYDLAATLQYVHDEAGQRVHYVGHSLGTLVAFAAFSKGEMTELVRSGVLLSPIAHLGQITSLLTRIMADDFVAETLSNLGIAEFDPLGKPVSNVLEDICSKPGVDCTDILTALTGQNCCLNSSIVQVFLENEPQPTATKNMVHLAQMIRRGTIAMYDYNDDSENRKHYGQTRPPEYEMGSISKELPLFLGYGGMDSLADVNDVQLLLNSLEDHESDKLQVQFLQNYAHADYVLGTNARQDVYEPVIAFLQAH